MRILPLTGAAGALCLIVAIGINWTGVCYEQRRILSNDEIVVHALRFARRTHSFPEALSNDEDIRRFIRDNPDCCYVSWTSSTIEDWQVKRLLGWAQVAVELRYKKRAPDREGAFYVMELVLSSCGERLAFRGMAHDRLPPTSI